MAIAPKKFNLSRDDIPDAPEWFGRVLEGLNPFANQVVAALSKGLTFGENCAMEVKTVKLVGPTRGWLDLTLASGWSTSSAWEGPDYRIDERGKVYLRGLFINAGAPAAGTTMATLPTGYTPGGGHVMLAAATGTPATGCVFILSTGTIQYQSGDAAAGIGLYGSFWADSPAATTPPESPWPVSVQHSLPVVAGVIPLRCVCTSGVAAELQGAPTFDWDAGNDGQVLLRNAYGLRAGLNYEATLLLVSG